MFPLNLTYSYQLYGGWIGPLFLAFVPLIIMFKEKRDSIVFNIFLFNLVLYFFILILKIDFLVRWNLIIFALLSIPLSIVGHNFICYHKERFNKYLAQLSIFAWLAFSLLYAGWKNVNCFPVVVGKETKDHYLKRMLPEDANFIDAFKYINESLSREVRILYVGSRGFYLDRDYIRFWRLSTGLLNEDLILDPNIFLRELRRLKITHVLIDYRTAEKHITRFNISFGQKLFNYLGYLISNRLIIPIYQENSCIIYEL